MFIVIYKKTKELNLYLIKFELVGNKYRKWRGPEGRLLKPSKWKEYTLVGNQTGKARAAFYMFQEVNRLVSKGYSIYKKKTKQLKTVKPIIRLRKYSFEKIKNWHEDGNTIYISPYDGVLAVRNSKGKIHQNNTRKLLQQQKAISSGKIEVGYFFNNQFIAFPWNQFGTPTEINMWVGFFKQNSIKFIIKVGENVYYA